MLTIGQVATHTGLSTSAIRFYERAGLLTPLVRSGGKRLFPRDAVHQLVIINFAKNIGFTLAEIKILLHDFPDNTAAPLRWNKLAKAKIAEMEGLIVRATTAKEMLESVLECRCVKLEDCAAQLTEPVRPESDQFWRKRWSV